MKITLPNTQLLNPKATKTMNNTLSDNLTELKRIQSDLNKALKSLEDRDYWGCIGQLYCVSANSLRLIKELKQTAESFN